MEKHYTVLNQLTSDIKLKKIDSKDYIRVKRSENYNKFLFNKFGIMFMTIEHYKYDFEEVSLVNRDQYELMKVEDIFNEASKLIYFIK